MKHSRSHKIRSLFNEQSGYCAYCETEMTLELGYDKTATVDHVIAQSLGGPKKHFNEVAACNKCNNQKGNMPIADWLRVLMERKENERREKARDQAGVYAEGYRVFGLGQAQH